MRHRAALAGLGVGVFVLYAWGVGRAPVYLYIDEVVFALQAHAIATTGHDLGGRLLPVYFHMPLIADYVWFQPVIVYVTALFLRMLPVTEATLRWPSAAIGAIDVLLMYAIAVRLFGSRRWAWAAAILLALTPSHFIHSRMALDYLYPVPFVMGWLLCLISFVERPNARTLFIATSLLGIGMFSYIASIVMMPLYLALTLLTLIGIATKDFRTYAVAIAGFIWPFAIVVLWLIAHPEVVGATFGKYQLGTYQARAAVGAAGTLVDVLQDLRRPVHFSDVTGRLSLAWYFFDPAYLFLTGGYAHLANSTRRVGVFLAPLIVFVPVGLAYLGMRKRTPAGTLLLLSFFTAPLAAVVVVPEPYAIDRELEVLPFAILAAVFGARAMLASPAIVWRRLAVVLIALLPLHFLFFVADYSRDYPMRLAYAFQGNRRAALEEIIDRAPLQQPPSIYLSSERIPYIEAHWRFYLLKHKREDLLTHTIYLNGTGKSLRTVGPGALVLTRDDDPEAAEMVRDGHLRKIEAFPEPGNPPLFALYQR
jgi:4-amino-4-deoxy-L-arabinose transferase-like glycosyltransferase